MRILILLVTSVCLAGCVHDTNDFNLFVADSGASLYYAASDEDTSQKDHDDPWTEISRLFPLESEATNSGKAHDDPWTRILDLLPKGFEEDHLSFHGRAISNMVFVGFENGGSKSDDPWDRINENFSIGAAKSVVLCELKEVRGNIGRFEFMDGRSLFGVGVPIGWGTGLVLRGEAFLLETKEAYPLLGAIVWDVDRTLMVENKPR
jgi:hypothetical protein